MTKLCKYCKKSIPQIRSTNAIFCSRACQEEWRLNEGHELSKQQRIRRRIRKQEQEANGLLKSYLDEQTTLSRIRLEEKLKGRPRPEGKPPGQLLLVRPELEKEKPLTRHAALAAYQTRRKPLRKARET